MSSMRGIGWSKRQLRDHLEANFCDYLVRWREDAGVGDITAPDPVAYFHNEPQALDRFPLVTVSTARTMVDRLQENTNLGSDYRTRHDMRVFIWARGEGWNETIDMRDNLTSALRTFIMLHPAFGDACAFIDATTVMVELSDVQPVNGERFVAGAFVGFTALVDEELQHPSAGIVNSVDATYDILATTHPALE